MYIDRPQLSSQVIRRWLAADTNERSSKGSSNAGHDASEHQTPSLRLPKLDCVSGAGSIQKHKYAHATTADLVRRAAAIRLPTRTLKPSIPRSRRLHAADASGLRPRPTGRCRPGRLHPDHAAGTPDQAHENIWRPKPPSNWSTPRPAARRGPLALSSRFWTRRVDAERRISRGAAATNGQALETVKQHMKRRHQGPGRGGGRTGDEDARDLAAAVRVLPLRPGARPVEYELMMNYVQRCKS